MIWHIQIKTNCKDLLATILATGDLLATKLATGNGSPTIQNSTQGRQTKDGLRINTRL